MAKKKKDKGPGLTGEEILISILIALAGGIAVFLVVLIGGSILAPDLFGEATADQPPAATQRGTLPSSAPARTQTPVQTQAPTQAPAEPSEDPSSEPPPEPSIAPPEAPIQTVSTEQAQTPTPAPVATPTPTQPTAVVSVQPVVPNQVPAQSGNQGGSGSGNWGESSATSEITGDLSRTAYWVNGGKSYHFSKDCPSLSRSRNIQTGTLQDAIDAGKTDPCNNCAGGN